jgi:hypothetical protein
VGDAQGTLVGPVVQSSRTPVSAKSLNGAAPLPVARQIPGKWIQLLVTRDVRGTNDSVPFLYEDYDRSGPASLEAP